MTDYKPWYTARDDLFCAVRDDLQGVDDAVITAKPLDRMIVGILFPRPDSSNNQAEILESESPVPLLDQSKSKTIGASLDAEPGPDIDTALSNAARPSSIGLTAAVSNVNVVNGLTRDLLIHYEATCYVQTREKTTEHSEEWTPTTVRDTTPISINLANPQNYGKPLRFPIGEVDNKLSIVAIVREPHEDRIRITVSLVNEQTYPKKGKSDAFCWFRPSLTLELDGGEFIDGRPNRELKNRDKEIQALDFLYRNDRLLAQGHGCSPTWDDSAPEVRSISSTFFPSYEVKQSSAAVIDGPNAEFGNYDLHATTISTDEGLSELRALANAYEAWIETKRRMLTREFKSSDELSESGYLIGKENLDSAAKCLARIREGIDLLSNPEKADVWRAFQLMNRAMIRNSLSRSLKNRPYSGFSDEDFENSTFEWRPFQIAFILMNLPGLSDINHPDRQLADLLWFPTGGGKTEAYLGCIAFSILLRRIRNSHDGGVSAIMRYTLRMLTTDQYGRAASLICALEMIRREFLPDSVVPISLGLWVGQSSSPNHLKDVQKQLRDIDSGEKEPDESTIYHVRNCPNCGAQILIENYAIVDDSLRITCETPQCEFRQGLPLYFVDDDVYEKRPSLVIGTVDKFAQMTWQSKVAQLLSMDEKYSAPDLIIQDELHLISGPLGTMVALYESALDLAITKASGMPPKVIASTATIRRADAQVRAIFDREASQFPPAGIDPNDNYFSTSAPKEKKATRRYVGAIAPATSQMTLLVRLYAVLLQRAHELEAPDEVKDSYWTLLGYFNSLRVLGSAYLQAVSDVPDRVELLAKRHHTEPRPAIRSEEPLELTSRVTAGQILRMRNQLGNEDFDPVKTPNLVLATNMISVGLDIPRLGLMVVSGQPQNTSEYIQATSRVGRRDPGLVFVAFNATRTRDVSHFESFEAFHRSLYRAVEPTTATPFAARARERGAHGILVAAARLMFEGMRGSDSVENVVEFQKEIREQIIKPFVSRANSVTLFERPWTTTSTDEAKALNRRLEALLDEWIQGVEKQEITNYGKMKHPGASTSAKKGERSLLVQAGSEGAPSSFEVSPPWPTITSLRDVDAETALYERFISDKKKEN